MITALDLMESPAWYPLQPLPDGTLQLLKLGESDYRAASFLDQRLAQQPRRLERGGIDVVREAADRLAPRAHFIFHTGHVGSTLASRLLGEHPALFSLREPALLRPLADSTAASALDLRRTLGLFSRTWRPRQRALIKVTSFVSERASDMLALEDGARAILMCTSPSSYLRGILGGPNSRVESRALAPSRQARLATRLGNGPWQPASEGEQVAMSWLCEMTALLQAAQRHVAQVHWVNFDVFLAAPAPGLASMLETFGVSLATKEVEQLVHGPLMRQYSKAPEHAYDAALRQEVLQSADFEHGPEIRRGLAWLERLAAQHALVRQTLACVPRQG
jgi:hypothetical protein